MLLCNFELPCEIDSYQTNDRTVTCISKPWRRPQTCDLQVISDGDRIAQPSGSFNYRIANTPEIIAIIPNTVISYSTLNVYQIPRVSIKQSIANIKIGGVELSPQQSSSDIPGQGTPITASAKQSIKFDVPGDRLLAGYYNLSQYSLENTGNALIWNYNYFEGPDGGIYNIAYVRPISFMFPEIGTKWGNLITIFGEFTTDCGSIKVTVGGVSNAKIVSCLSYMIVVLLPPVVDVNAPVSNRAHSGVFFRLYSGVNSLQEAQSMTTDYFFYQPVPEMIDPNQRIAKFFKGWFIAPATGDYRFFLSGSNQGYFYFSPVADDPSAKVLAASFGSATGIREFYAFDTQRSQNFTLQKDRIYYFEGWTYQQASNGYFSVGVEVPIDGAGKPSTVAEVQQISISAEVDRELINVTVTCSQEQQWRLRLLDNSTGVDKAVYTGNVSCSDSISAIKSKLQQGFTGGSIDVSGSLVSNNTTTVTYEYIITVYYVRTTTGPTFDPISGDPTGEVNVLQAHSPLLSGSISVLFWGSLIQIGVCDSADSLMNKLLTVPGVVYPVVVTMSGSCQYTGATWVIRFLGTQGDIPIPTLVTNGILGGGGINSPTVNFVEIQNGTLSRQFWVPIPNYLIMADPDQPQLSIEVDNMRLLCQLNCNYKYQEDMGVPIDHMVTGFNYTQPYSVFLNMTSQNPPVAYPEYVFFAGLQSYYIVFYDYDSPATLEAIFDDRGDGYPNFLAGVWIPYFAFGGFAPWDTSLPPITIYPQLFYIYPSSGGIGGYTEVTIVGGNFGPSLEDPQGTEVTIGGAPCSIQSLMSTQIVCITGRQVSGNDIVISVNPSYDLSDTAVSSTFSGFFTYVDHQFTIASINPSSRNPGVPIQITISGTGFGTDASQLSVYLDNSTHIPAYPCNINSVTDTTILCTLSGGRATSEGYSVRVVKTGVGAAAVSNPADAKFYFQLEVTSITPTIGSHNGGTLLTVTGVNFIADPQRIQLTIGNELLMCQIVGTPTTSQFHCITPANTAGYQGAQKVNVLSRIVDVAKCKDANGCTFTYSDSETPVITDMSPLSGHAGDLITLTGLSLDSTTSATSSDATITVDGIAAEAVSQNSTHIVFKIPSAVVAGSNKQVSVNVFNKGLATWNNAVVPAISVLKTVSSVVPATVSLAGGILNISGGGFIGTEQLTVTGGTCKILSIVPNQIQCELSSTSSGDHNLTVSGVTSTTFVVSSSSSVTATVTSVLVNGEATNTITNINGGFTLTIEGSNLGQEAPIVTLISLSNSSKVYTSTLSTAPEASATSFDAPFADVPYGSYKLRVNYPSYGFASIASSVTNNFAVTWNVQSPLPANIASSIAGGIEFSIQGSGFPTAENDLQNLSLTVCGLPAELRSSSNSVLVYRAPPFLVPLSNKVYSITSGSTKLNGTFFASSNPTKIPLVFDGNYSTAYTQTGSGECYLGVDFGAGLRGQLHYIKYFPQQGQNPSLLSGTVLESCDTNCEDSTNWSLLQQNGEMVAIPVSVNSGYNTIMFDDSDTLNLPYHRQYRLRSPTGYCRYAELEFYGVLMIDKPVNLDLTLNSCDGVLSYLNQATTLPSLITYQATATPIVTSTTPTYGTSAGGTVVTISGSGFPASPVSINDVQVTIDGNACTLSSLSSITASSITCTTSYAGSRELRPFVLQSKIRVYVASSGYAAGAAAVSFMYVESWSDIDTWGGDSKPRFGDTLIIPKGLALLIDESPEELNAVIIEGGALIFADQDIEFKAHYITIIGGLFRAGTPDAPFTHKLTITLIGEKSDVNLPVFGNKVLALTGSGGLIDLNGIPRNPVWTELWSIAAANTSQLILKEPVDWQPGEIIVISSTSHDHQESEKLTISMVSNTTIDGAIRSIVTIVGLLKYDHYAIAETYIDGNGNPETFEMRAEVGLLTRNIVFQGDDASDETEYGAQLMVYSVSSSAGLSSSNEAPPNARISYVEITKAGQATLIGRYPINFHSLGTVTNSFIRGASFHETYNRATSISGVNYLTVDNNVYYRCKGHNVFLEDGTENYNLISNNLVISTRSAFSNDITERIPASFFITNPNNQWVNNRAAGSDGYGFWIYLTPKPTGASFGNSICPAGEILGEFDGNQAHSNNHTGLYIHPILNPRQNPCGSATDSVANPPVPGVIQNYKAWKNKASGIFANQIGEITFANMQIADTLQSGIEISAGGLFRLQKLVIENATLVGMSSQCCENQNVTSAYFTSPFRGIVTPRVDGLLVSNVRFHNFATPATLSSTSKVQSAFQDCSLCQYSSTADSGARTAFTRGLWFNETSFLGTRVLFNVPYRGIFRDLDGTLVKKTIPTVTAGWVTASFPHNKAAVECQEDVANYNGLVCDNSVQVRRVVLYSASSSINGNNLYILNCGKGTVTNEACDNLNNTLYPAANFSTVQYRSQANPSNSWAVPYVTGYTYNLHWGASGIDWQGLTIQNANLYETNDQTITLRINTTAYREVFDVKTSSFMIPNVTQLWSSSNVAYYGDWYHNATAKYLYFAVNGNQVKNLTTDSTTITQNRTNLPIALVAYGCLLNCPKPPSEVPREDIIRNWSQMTMGPGSGNTNGSAGGGNGSSSGGNSSGSVGGGDPLNIVIPPAWRVRVDVSRIPAEGELNSLNIEGELLFDDLTPDEVTIYVNAIWVQGRFAIGNETYTYPSNKKVTIVHIGNRTSKGLQLQNQQYTTNNVIAVTGYFGVFAESSPVFSTRLTQTALAQSSTLSICMPPNFDWSVGDIISISPTFRNINEHEIFAITAIDTTQSTITINGTLSFDHYGSPSIANNAEGYGAGDFDRRAVVTKLNRNIMITSVGIDAWGSSLYVTEYTYDFIFEGNVFPVRTRGVLNITGLWCDFCGQAGTTNAGVRIENLSPLGNMSYLNNSVFTRSKGISVYLSNVNNITLSQNTIVESVKFGLVITGTSNSRVIIQDNVIVGTSYPTEPTISDTQLTGCFYADASVGSSSSVSGNLVAGCALHGYILQGSPCPSSSEWAYSNNTAVASEYGVYINSPARDCVYASGLITIASSIVGVSTYAQVDTIVFENFTIVDNAIGFAIQQGEYTELITSANFKNIFLSGANLQGDQYAAGLNYGDKGCANNTGFYLGTSTLDSKAVTPILTHLPWWLIESPSSFGSYHTYEHFRVKNFADDRQDCTRNYVFSSQLNQSDGAAITFLQDFDIDSASVYQNNIARFHGLSSEEIIPNECGNGPCSGRKNILVQDVDGSVTGTPSAIFPRNFGVFDAFCREYGSMGSLCLATNWAILEFDSLDADNFTRIFSPITITSASGFSNIVNSFKAHTPDQSLIRLSRFSSLIRTGNQYTIQAVGTLPNSLRWQLLGAESDSWTIQSLQYPEKKSLIIRNVISNTLVQPAVLLGDPSAAIGSATIPCGAYTFDISSQTITFKLTGSSQCRITITVSNSLYLSAYYQLSQDQFYSLGGPTTVTDNIVALLGISATQVRTVSIKPATSSTGSRRLLEETSGIVVETLIDSQHLSSTLAQADFDSWYEALEGGFNAGNFSVGGVNPTYKISFYYADEQSDLQLASSLTELYIIIGVLGALALVTALVIAKVMIMSKQRKKQAEKKLKLKTNRLEIDTRRETTDVCSTEQGLTSSPLRSPLSLLSLRVSSSLNGSPLLKRKSNNSDEDPESKAASPIKLTKSRKSLDNSLSAPGEQGLGPLNIKLEPISLKSLDEIQDDLNDPPLEPISLKSLGMIYDDNEMRKPEEGSSTPDHKSIPEIVELPDNGVQTLQSVQNMEP